MKNFKSVIHQWSWIFMLLFLVVGIFNPALGSIALICMLAPVLAAFFQGRAWCGSYCPRGSFNDIILAKISHKGKIPPLYQRFWFRLLFLVLLMSAFAIQLSRAWGNPVAVGQVFVRMIIITTLITIVLGLFYQPRTWCRICPMGTLAYFITKLRLLPIKPKLISFQKNACVGCKICNKNCPMNIDVASFKTTGQVTHPDCLKCNACVAKCPKKALKYL
jgi:ferredoxin-type protein NapH